MSSSSYSKTSEVFQKTTSRGCAKKISQKKSSNNNQADLQQPLTIEIPAYNIKKAHIDWEAFDRLKYSYHKEHMCTLNNSESSFSRTSNTNSSGSGSTDSLIEEANDFLQVARKKLVTTQDWTQIQAKKSSKNRQNKSYDLEY